MDAREAYVDAIVLIVPGGPQNTVAWTDALEVDGVVLPAAAESTVGAAGDARRLLRAQLANQSATLGTNGNIQLRRRRNYRARH